MRRFVRVIAWVGIVVFVALVLNETVFSRAATENYHFSFQPFWSYEAIMNGRKNLIKEHYLNVFFHSFGNVDMVRIRAEEIVEGVGNRWCGIDAYRGYAICDETWILRFLRCDS